MPNFRLLTRTGPLHCQHLYGKSLDHIYCPSFAPLSFAVSPFRAFSSVHAAEAAGQRPPSGALHEHGSGGHDHGVTSMTDFEAQWTAFFRSAPDLFELQRGLNNCFGYDVVPTLPVLEEALRAARRLNCFPTSERILVGLRDKVETDEQYDLYLKALQPIRTELGVPTPEEMGV